MYSAAPVVSIKKLCLCTRQPDQFRSYLLRNVSLCLFEQEILVLTGSSGSGKTSLLMAMMGYLRPNVQCSSGRVCLNGCTILKPDYSEPMLRNSFWGKKVALVPQNAGSALTPSIKIYQQIEESLQLHTSLNTSQRRQRIYELLALMRIPKPEQSCKKYPHEFSGGQQQRIAIAMAIAPTPKLLLLDEPFSGLDQKNIHELMQLLKGIRQRNQTGMVMVSHDLNVVKHSADRVAILNKGKVEAFGTAQYIFSAQNQGEAAKLIKAFKPEIPSIKSLKQGSQVIQCNNMGLSYKKSGILNLLSPAASILNNISLEVRSGESIVITGHSGSGKTSVLNCIAGLVSINEGYIQFNQKPLDKLSKRPLADKKNIQLIFQNSDLSLNPAMTIQQILQAPLQLYFQLSGQEITKKVSELLEKVHLPQHYLALKPARLSGGERQRIAIARAFAASPKLLLCDEITASLDVVNRNKILALVRELVIDDHCGCLMVTHEQEVIRQIAQRIYVMAQGEIISHLSREEYLMINMLPVNPKKPKDHCEKKTLECVA